MDRSDRYWDDVAGAMAKSYHLDPVMAEQKRRVHVDLLRSWCGASPAGRILKTDLFEEALGGDEVLTGWPEEDAPARLCGIDISRRICTGARDRLTASNRRIDVLVCDARHLPFRDESFDIVFSCSTLDHFIGEEGLCAGFREAVRVLREGGRLVLLLDNPRSLFYPAVRWLGKKGKIPFLLGETLTAAEAACMAGEFGLTVLDQRAVYHVPRLVATALFRALRALRLGFADRFLLRTFGVLERRSGKGGEYRTGWYTATLLAKEGTSPVRGEDR